MARRAFIIYGAQSGIVRRVVQTDESTFDIQKHLVAGEDWTVENLIEGQIGLDITGIMQRNKGITPPSARCAVVDQSADVVAVRMADPILDSIPNHTLVRSLVADIGWKHRGNNTFDAPPRPVIPSSTSATPSSDIVPPSSAIGLNPGKG